LELSSPKVKNAPVKPFFALTYFIMLLASLREAIQEVVTNEELEKAQPVEKFETRKEVSEYLYEYQPVEDSFNMNNASTSTKISAAASKKGSKKCVLANKKRQSINSSMLSMNDR
jgi:hypothetical protein